MKPIFAGSFSNEADIEKEFQMDKGYLKSNKIKILYAFYNIDGYEGDAHILYKHGRKLYEVHGSHCSCYGLEGQWKPETTSVKELLARIARTDWNSHYFAGAKDLLLSMQRKSLNTVLTESSDAEKLKVEIKAAKNLGLSHAQYKTLERSQDTKKLIYTWTKTGVISYNTFVKLLNWTTVV